MNEIELVFPTKVHEIDAKEYFEEHILNGESTLHGDSGLDNADRMGFRFHHLRDKEKTANRK